MSFNALSSPTAAAPRQRGVTLLVIALVTALMAAIVALNAPGAEAQVSPPSPPDYEALQAELNEAQFSNWGLNNLGDYEMTYRIVCFCARRTTVTVTTNDGEPSWAAADGLRTEPWQELVVQDLFEVIQTAIDDRYDAIAVSYNEFGVPVSIQADPSFMIADEERTILVDDFMFTEPIDQRAEYEAARSLWNENFGPDSLASYEMTYQQYCFCHPDWTVPQTTWVHGATIENWQSSNATTNVEGPQYSMEDLFDRIDTSIGNVYQLDVEYHREYGYPVSVSTDLGQWIADDGVTIVVSEFVPNSRLAQAFHDARIMVENIEEPVSQGAVTYARQCSLNRCSEAESVAAKIQVDITNEPGSSEPGGMSVTGFLPLDANQPALTWYGAAKDWLVGLEQAAAFITQNDGWAVDAGWQANGELFYWESYELAIVPDRLVEPQRIILPPELIPQTLSYELLSIDPYGCCSGPSNIVYAESFENVIPAAPGDQWTTGPDNAVTGSFEVGDPEQTQRGRTIVQPEDASDGQFALVTGPEAGSFSGANDIDGGFVFATSPEISIPDRTPVMLSMDWYFGHAGAFDGRDSFTISISVPGSRQADRVIVERTDTNHRNGSWETVTADLSGYGGRSIQIKVAASDVGARSVSEAGIDNIVITQGMTQPEPAFWSENFDSGDAGVTVRGTAVRGEWNVGAPEATSWRGTDLQVGNTTSGGQALITDTRAGDNAGSFDVDRGFTSATVGDVMLPITFAPVEFILDFDWYFAHLRNAAERDNFVVSVQGSAGDKLVVLNEEADGTNRPGVWSNTRVDISRFQGQTISIVITATDSGRVSLVEAGVDSMTIEMNNLPLPPVGPPE